MRKFISVLIVMVMVILLTDQGTVHAVTAMSIQVSVGGINKTLSDNASIVCIKEDSTVFKVSGGNASKYQFSVKNMDTNTNLGIATSKSSNGTFSIKIDTSGYYKIWYSALDKNGNQIATGTNYINIVAASKYENISTPEKATLLTYFVRMDNVNLSDFQNDTFRSISMVKKTEAVFYLPKAYISDLYMELDQGTYGEISDFATFLVGLIPFKIGTAFDAVTTFTDSEKTSLKNSLYNIKKSKTVYGAKVTIYSYYSNVIINDIYGKRNVYTVTPKISVSNWDGSTKLSRIENKMDISNGVYTLE